MFGFAIEIIQSICLIIAAIIILITAFGILRLDDGMEKVIYVRIHMLGMVDIACVLAMIGLGQYLIAGVYFVLAPFVAHAMANAYYHGEDDRKYETNDELVGRVSDTIYTELALSEDTTIDAEFKSAFESSVKISSEPNNFSIGSSGISSVSNSNNTTDTTNNINNTNNSTNNKSTLKSDVVSYTKLEESKGNISDKLDVVIKEVSTDDIENSSLSKANNKDIKVNNKDIAENNSKNNSNDNKINNDEDRGEKHD